MTRLEVGIRYRSLGGGSEVTIKEVDEDQQVYRVEHHTKGACSPYIHFNAERYWKPVADPVLDLSPAHWTDGKLVGFDLETTGVDVESARIVTASIVVVGDGPMRTYDWVADPGIEIPEEAAKIHGYTTARARAEGRSAHEVVAEVLDRLEACTADGAPLAAFNARFDFTIADREARRHGLVPFVPRRALDPRIIDGFTDRYRKGKRTLQAVSDAYGVRLDAAHEAMSDALAACRAAWVLGRKGKVIRREDWPAAAQEARECRAEWAACKDDLDKLHAAQERWAREKAIDLAQHFRDNGNVEAAARCLREADGWPIIPFEEARVA